MTGCKRGECAVVVIPLSSKYTLRREQVGVGSLPATGNSGTMEIDQQVVARGILEQINAVVHVHLTVA